MVRDSDLAPCNIKYMQVYKKKVGMGVEGGLFAWTPPDSGITTAGCNWKLGL